MTGNRGPFCGCACDEGQSASAISYTDAFFDFLMTKVYYLSNQIFFDK